MTFNSAAFLAFLPVVFTLYWLLRRGSLNWQNRFVLAASYFFYGWWDWRFLGLLALSTATDFSIGRWLEKETGPVARKRILLASLFLNLGLLGFFKYFHFFTDSFVALAKGLGWAVSPFTLKVLLPVGISFYTFQSLSYTIDVYRRQIPAVRDFWAFAAFVSFFPQLVAGPIERARHLLPQFAARRHFNYEMAVSGCRLALWGFLKKVALADNLAPVVARVFDHPSGQNAWTVAAASVCFALQIYGDFSGYSDIATGTARLFGFDLMQNFRTPYFAASIREFWQRWHVSLSTWFRDYVYIPLGGNRNGMLAQMRNLLITFVLSGLWHGANWTFVLWGFWHGILVCIETALPVRPFGSRPAGAFARGVFVFALVCAGWIFFRAKDIDTARLLLSQLTVFPPGGLSGIAGLFPSPAKATALPAFAALFFAVEWVTRESDINALFARMPAPLRWAGYYVMTGAILLLGAFDDAPVFIYFQF